MFSPQGIAGLIMIKPSDSPGCGILLVTTGTAFFKGGTMRIPVTIAAIAKTKALPFLLLVTFKTSHLPMGS
jgi:hypothetical protein